MAFTFSWTDKQTGDCILASDINSLAGGVEETQAEFTDYLTKSDASTTYVPQLITNTQSCEVSTSSGKFYLTTARGGKLYIGGDPGTVFLNGLITPTEDTSAATKKYVDDTVPTKVSQLENDEKYIKNTGTDIDADRTVTKIGDDSLYLIELSAYQIHLNASSSGYVSISNLQDPTSDRDAANKQYVDSAIASAITTALNTAV